MRIATVTVLVLFLAAAAGCAGNPTSSQAAQCESGRRVAYEELDVAKSSGLSGTVEYSKAAGLLTAFVGAAVFGWFCVRLSGVYFAMLTLAFAQIAWSIVFQWRGLTGGDDGILNVWPAAWASDKIVYYELTLAIATVGIQFMRHVLYAPFGYGLRAGRDSPLRADAIGRDVRLRQWHGFVFAGFMAGPAGTPLVFS